MLITANDRKPLKKKRRIYKSCYVSQTLLPRHRGLPSVRRQFASKQYYRKKMRSILDEQQI